MVEHVPRYDPPEGSPGHLYAQVPWVQPLAQDFRVLSRSPYRRFLGIGGYGNKAANSWLTGYYRMYGTPFPLGNPPPTPNESAANAINSPTRQPQRIEWQEAFRVPGGENNIVASSALAFQNAPINLNVIGVTQTFELARVTMPPNGVGVLEQVTTYVRCKQQSPIAAQQAIVYQSGPNARVGINAFTHTGGAVPGGFIVTIEYTLTRQGLGAQAPRPAFLTAASPTSIPVEPVPGLPYQWRDQRYGWNDQFGQNPKRVLVSGGSLVRLFVTLRTSGSNLLPGQFLQFVLAGGLSGFYQQGGPDGCALSTVTHRFA